MALRAARALATLALLACLPRRASGSAESYYGGSLIAMAGDGCVGIACDCRLGHGPQTISNEARRVMRVNDRSLVGFTGIYGVAQQVAQVLDEAEQERRMVDGASLSPATTAQFLSRVMWESKGLPCEAVVAGLKGGRRGGGGGPGLEAYLCGMDGLGAKVLARDFVVAGSASEALYGACEAAFRENMGADELRDTLHGCMRSAMERDCLSGGDVVVHIVTGDGLRSQRFAGRDD